MLGNKRALLFDAGHTLLEPRVPVVAVYHDAARQVGAEVPRQAFEDRFHAMWRELARQFRAVDANLETSDARERENWRHFTAALALPFPQLLERHEAWLSTLFAHFDRPDAWVPAPGAHAVLASLAREGIEMGVVSNWHSVLHDILRGHDLTSCFAFVLTSAEIGHRKPHGKIFSAAIEQLGLAPNEIAHVGDSWEEDVEGALAAGITPIYLTSGETPSTDYGENVMKISTLRALVQ